jgi:hypothetical protein
MRNSTNHSLRAVSGLLPRMNPVPGMIAPGSS